jgi:hypothetical protein
MEIVLLYKRHSSRLIYSVAKKKIIMTLYFNVMQENKMSIRYYVSVGK